MKRCKKHNTDLSSIIGICASCLRDRLFKLILAQEQAQAQSLSHNNNDNLDSEAKPAIPLTRRKSDTSVASVAVHVSKPYTKPRLNHSLSDQRFHNSPQIAINTGGCIGSSSSNSNSNTKKNRNSLSRFSSFSNIFKSKSRNENGDANSKNSVSISNGVERRVCVRDRGMSPVRLSIDGKEDELLSSEYESCKQTPQKTPINRRGGGGGGGGGNRSVTELILCLSPLVRASPNRLWSVKGKPAAATTSADGDEIRTPVAPHLSYTKSFYANRSRKLADFGRPDPNR